jgi:hypothetical protein
MKLFPIVMLVRKCGHAQIHAITVVANYKNRLVALDSDACVCL